MVKDPANGSESGCDMPQPSESRLFRAWSEVTRRSPRLILGSAEATSGSILCGGEVTQRPLSTIPISPPPSFIATRQAPLLPIEGAGAEVTGRTSQLTMPMLPPPIYPSKERIPCLHCKENRIDCHGPETQYYGDCSNCHEAGKRCEFEAYVLDTPSSLPNPQSSAINNAMLHPTASTSNDDCTHIDIPAPQPNTSPSSRRQIDQNPPVKDPSRDPEISNIIGVTTSNSSISDVPRIKPWWKRIFSRISCCG